jgi:competence protein ComEA
MTAGAIIALLSAGFLMWRLGSAPSPAEAVAADAISAKGTTLRHSGASTASPRAVMVYVSGAVVSPGLYRLPASLRIGDALAAAGGLLSDADPDRLPNLAGKLSDGKQVKVARLKAGTSRAGAVAKVDINSAEAATLAAVPGIDPALAQAIVDYRAGYGPFASVAELKTALGLDASTLGAIRRYLTAY